MPADSQTPEVIELLDSSDDEEDSAGEDDESDPSRESSSSSDQSEPEEEESSPEPNPSLTGATSAPTHDHEEPETVEQDAEELLQEQDSLAFIADAVSSATSLPTSGNVPPMVPEATSRLDLDEDIVPTADALLAQILVELADEPAYDGLELEVEEISVQEPVETTIAGEASPSPADIDDPIDHPEAEGKVEEVHVDDDGEESNPLIESAPENALETTDSLGPDQQVSDEVLQADATTVVEADLAKETSDELPDPYMPAPDTEQRIPLSPHPRPEGRSVSPSLVVEPPAKQDEISALPSAFPTRADTPTVMPDPYEAPADAFLSAPISPHDLEPSNSTSPSLLVEPPMHDPDPSSVTVEPSLQPADPSPSPSTSSAQLRQPGLPQPLWPDEAAASLEPEPPRPEADVVDEPQSVSPQTDSKSSTDGELSGQSSDLHAASHTPTLADEPADEEGSHEGRAIGLCDEASPQDEDEAPEESVVQGVHAQAANSVPDFESGPGVVNAPELPSTSTDADVPPSPVESRVGDDSDSLVDFADTIVARELQEEPLLRHHHGADPLQDAPIEPSRTPRHRRGRSSINTVAHLPLTRSQCTYRKLLLREGDLSAIVLAPQCVTADTEKLQEEGISTDGAPTRSQEALAHSQRITPDAPRIHPSLLAQLHRLVGLKMVDEGHIYLLDAPVGSRAEDVEEAEDIIRTPTAARRSMTPRRPRLSTVSTAEPEDRDVDIKVEVQVEGASAMTPRPEASPTVSKGRRSQRLSTSVEPASPMVTRLRTRQAEAASQQHDDAEPLSPQHTQTVLPTTLARRSVSIAVPEDDGRETSAPSESGPSTRTRSQKRKHEPEDPVVPTEPTDIVHPVEDEANDAAVEVDPTDPSGSGNKKKRRLATDRSFIPGSDEEDVLGEDVQVSVTSSARKRKGRASAAASGLDGAAWRELKDDDEENAFVPDGSPSVRKTRSMVKRQLPPPEVDAPGEKEAEAMDIEVQVEVQEETKPPPATRKRRWGWNPFGRK